MSTRALVIEEACLTLRLMAEDVWRCVMRYFPSHQPQGASKQASP
jgi:hypothetical protein